MTLLVLYFGGRELAQWSVKADEFGDRDRPSRSRSESLARCTGKKTRSTGNAQIKPKAGGLGYNSDSDLSRALRHINLDTESIGVSTIDSESELAP